MTPTIAAIAAGASLGFAVACPIGPMALLCIHRTLRHGPGPGLATGLGAATVHFVLGLIVLTGADAAARFWLEKEGALFYGLAACVFLWCAIRALRSPIDASFGGRRAPQGLFRSYGGALAIGAANPMTFLLFAAASPVMLTSGVAGQASIAALGVFLGSAGWWLVLTCLAAFVRGRLCASGLARCNIAASALLGGFAVAAAGKALGWSF
jgi:threonine/homoserine/homoserine lactone efflux protein